MTLVDTSSWIHFLRKRGDLVVKERVRKLLESGEACLCPMVEVELWMGAGSEKDRCDIASLRQNLPMLEINQDVWAEAGRLSRICCQSGTPVPSSDVTIAACAFIHEAEIESVDGHFTLLRGYRG